MKEHVKTAVHIGGCVRIDFLDESLDDDLVESSDSDADAWCSEDDYIQEMYNEDIIPSGFLIPAHRTPTNIFSKIHGKYCIVCVLLGEDCPFL